MKTHRPRQTAEQWAAIIKQFDESSLGANAFCEQHDLAPATFSKWQRRVRTQTLEKRPAFNKVQTVLSTAPAMPETSNNSVITLTLGRDITLTIQGVSVGT